MKRKITIIMPFWQDQSGDKERLVNAKLAFTQLQLFKNYCNRTQDQHNIEVSAFGYDFSSSRKLPVNELIKYVKFPDGFNKSAKINYAVNECAKDSDFIVCLDSDVYLSPMDFKDLLLDFQNIEYTQAYTYQFRYMKTNKGKRTASPDIDFRTCWANAKDTEISTLGGWFIIPTYAFKQVNGYNQEFTAWGFEDDELKCKLRLHGIDFYQRDTCLLHLYHKHQYQVISKEEKQQVKIQRRILLNLQKQVLEKYPDLEILDQT